MIKPRMTCYGLLFATGPDVPEHIRTICENSDFQEVIRYSDGSLLLRETPEQFEKFWSIWIIMNPESV